MFRCLLERECKTLWSSRQALLRVITLYVILGLLPVFTHPGKLALQAPTALWIAAIVSLMQAFPRLLDQDYRNGCLQQLLLGADSQAMIVASKLIAFWGMQLLPLLLVTPLCAMMMHMPLVQQGLLMVSFVLGLPILLILGMLMTALSLTAKQQSVLLGLLLLPLMLPVLVISISLVHTHGEDLIKGLCLLLGIFSVALAVGPPLIIAALRLYDVRQL